jgi:hypothetical protein
MEFLTKQEKVTYKTARTKDIINVIIFVFRNNKHINTITLTNKQAQNKLINVLIDKAINQNKTKIQVDNITRTIKVEQQKEQILYNDDIIKYKYIYTFNNIPEKIYLY